METLSPHTQHGKHDTNRLLQMNKKPKIGSHISRRQYPLRLFMKNENTKQTRKPLFAAGSEVMCVVVCAVVMTQHHSHNYASNSLRVKSEGQKQNLQCWKAILVRLSHRWLTKV